MAKKIRDWLAGRRIRSVLAGALWCGWVALAPMPAAALDVNQASAQALTQIRGIGPTTALRIVRERERGGPYLSLEDLADRVRGIGPKRVRQWQRSGLRVGSSVGRDPAYEAHTRTRLPAP